MLASAILESAIGTVLIYALLSLFTSAIIEWVTRWANLRSNILESQILNLLGPSLARALRAHQLVHGMFDRGRFPIYIPTSTFALTLLQIAYYYVPGVGGNPGITCVQHRWQRRDRGLLQGLRQSATSLGPIQTRVEKWFDQAMEQASGRFKRKAQLFILGLSLAIVAGADIDTIAIAERLYTGAILKAPSRFPIFWNEPICSVMWIPKIAGIILSWGAISLGAPFWFDLLNKLVNLRQTGIPPDEAQLKEPGVRFMAQ